MQVCHPGSHISIWSGCNVVSPPINDEVLASTARLRQAFFAFLRMDCRVEGIFVAGAVGGEARWEVTASLTMEAICAWMSLVVLSSSSFRTNLFSSLAMTDASWRLDDLLLPPFLASFSPPFFFKGFCFLHSLSSSFCSFDKLSYSTGVWYRRCTPVLPILAFFGIVVELISPFTDSSSSSTDEICAALWFILGHSGTPLGHGIVW